MAATLRDGRNPDRPRAVTLPGYVNAFKFLDFPGSQTSGLPLAEVADSCARTSQCSTILPWASRRKISTPLLPSGPYTGAAPVNFECVITKSQSAKTRLMSTCVSGNAFVKLLGVHTRPGALVAVEDADSAFVAGVAARREGDAEAQAERREQGGYE